MADVCNRGPISMQSYKYITYIEEVLCASLYDSYIYDIPAPFDLFTECSIRKQDKSKNERLVCVETDRRTTR